MITSTSAEARSAGGGESVLSAREVADAPAAVHALTPVPTLVLHTKYWANVEHPTTVGLGDTFVGGFLAAVTRLVT